VKKRMSLSDLRGFDVGRWARVVIIALILMGAVAGVLLLDDAPVYAEKGSCQDTCTQRAQAGEGQDDPDFVATCTEECSFVLNGK